MRLLLIGLFTAAALALALGLMASGASIAGIEVWKILLALLGFLLFAAGGRARQRGGS